jgi:hypothetical protein
MAQNMARVKLRVCCLRRKTIEGTSTLSKLNRDGGTGLSGLAWKLLEWATSPPTASFYRSDDPVNFR